MTETVIASPVGPLRLEASARALTGLWFAPDAEPIDAPADGVLGSAAEQLAAYFAGDLRDFDLPLEPSGTEFQRSVWDALRGIDYGQTTSYGELARRLDLRPGASRAVGLANGSNPISIIVPCHRVIGADGTLTGYGGGLPIKRFLLDLEQRTVGQQELFALE